MKALFALLCLLPFGIILGLLSEPSVRCQQTGVNLAPVRPFPSSSSQVHIFLKLRKLLKHIICGFQWVWTSCLKWDTNNWINSCTCIWTFSRHNEMDNYFRVSLIYISARQQKKTGWHIWAGKRAPCYQKCCDRHLGSTLETKKPVHFQAPKAKPFGFRDVQFSHYKHHGTQRNSCRLSNYFLSLK